LGLLRAKKDRNGGEKLKFLDEVEFRPAKKIESRKIAELFSISSDGVADYIWSLSKADGEEILDVGQKRYENPDSHFSYKNCTIAEYNHEVIGMLVAFPMYVEKIKISMIQTRFFFHMRNLKKTNLFISAELLCMKNSGGKA